jgi:ubiquinone/menaquinone biosynthesis C-methylase UbiE
VSDAVRAFDKLAYVYDDWYRTAKGSQVYEAERSLLDNMLPETGVGVEVGAGTGVFTEALTNSGRCVVCLDPSKEMLTKAKQRGLPCILGSAESMPFKRGRLDFAYMITVLEFLTKPERAFNEAKRVNKTAAPLIVAFVDRDSSWGAHYKSMAESGDPIFRHAHLYSLGEVEKLARESGLSRVEAYGILTKGPLDPDAGGEVVEPSSKTGVIAMKLVATTRSPRP